MKHKVKHVHFVGIGGAGMSGIAEVLATLRYRVSGSDLAETPVTRRLRGLGVHIAIGHDAAHANGDIEDILALMSVVDEYVGVSNTNTHLRAGTGGPMRVLVPFPGEWRWGLSGERSPWFPTAIIERQKINAHWD